MSWTRNRPIAEIVQFRTDEAAIAQKFYVSPFGDELWDSLYVSSASAVPLANSTYLVTAGRAWRFIGTPGCRRRRNAF